ncbi:cyclase family protein [Minwuia thermotolerans]|uniref:cyclase family protein n=1 Tax=Minwuia thermotolerans TaxID=2056226 RepID=UPI000D6DC576|nr:cyclase family protein [Minwuia thermotolerans]
MASTTSEGAAAPTEQEVLGYFERLSNWGRWGKDDQKGTLNLITPDRRRAAAALVRDGDIVSCSRTLSPKRDVENPDPLLHFMRQSGESAPARGMGFASDWIGLEFHGFSTTHLDSLSHLFWDGRMYNGRPASGITTSRGGADGSIEWARDGIISRGVLLDMPWSQDRDWLEPGEAILPADLDACAAQAGVEVGEGDILLIRTGRDARRARHGPVAPAQGGAAGLHAACLPWLHEHGIAVLSSDVAQDVMPSGFDGIPMPIHAVGIVAMGLWLLDNAWLEDLAEHCRRRERWAFHMTVAPLPLKNTTGSPVNPIALF